jgi:cytochrome P450
MTRSTPLLRLLIIAKQATYKAYGNLMFMLLSHPDQLNAVLADALGGARDRGRSASKQPLASVQRAKAIPDRRCRRRRRMPVVNIGAANHDRPVGGATRTFDIFRNRPDRHISFGFGHHRCLG